MNILKKSKLLIVCYSLECKKKTKKKNKKKKKNKDTVLKKIVHMAISKVNFLCRYLQNQMYLALKVPRVAAIYKTAYSKIVDGFMVLNFCTSSDDALYLYQVS